MLIPGHARQSVDSRTAAILFPLFQVDGGGGGSQAAGFGGDGDGAGLAAFEHQEVTAYFDPELSDWLSVVTADNQVLTVPREAPISRFTATSEDLAASGGSVAVWNRTHSARLAQLRHNYAPPARGNIVSPVVAAVGREMAAHREAITAKAEARRQTATRAERVARERGLPLPANPGMAAAYEAIFARNEPTAHEHD